MKHETVFKITAPKTPQHNWYAELAFKVLAAKARAMLSAAQFRRRNDKNYGGKQL